MSPRREPGSIVDRALAELDLSRTIAAEVPYFALVPGILSESDMVATVPGQLATWLERSGDIVATDAPLPLPELEIFACWHPRFDGEPGNEWLRSMIADAGDRLDLR